MVILPESELFVRTDFSNNLIWEEICNEVEDHDYGLKTVTLIDDIKYDGLKIEDLPKLNAEQVKHTFIFLVDKESILNHEHPILCVDLFEEFGKSFRVLPNEIFGVAANLSVGNMFFSEIANIVDEDGIFRGV